RGHRVDGVWVLGGVERTPERKMFAVAVPNRSSETLQNIISEYVRPGSIIHTDLWRGYIGLDVLGYQHYTVNHSRNFRDPETNACTNTIEGTWAGIKVGIPARNRTNYDMDNHLKEFLWRRKNANDLWGGFINALKLVYFEKCFILFKVFLSETIYSSLWFHQRKPFKETLILFCHSVESL